MQTHTIHQLIYGNYCDIEVHQEDSYVVLVQRTDPLTALTVSLDALPELLSALQDTLNFFKAPAREGVNHNQGQLFNPEDYA